MDSLDRFLTNVLKDLKSKGYVETLEILTEFTIKKGFEYLAEKAIEFLKNIIKKGYYFFTSSSKTTHNNSNYSYNYSNYSYNNSNYSYNYSNNNSNYSNNNSNNSIFDIIISLLNKFCSPDFNTIKYYINAAIALLKNLLRNWYNKPDVTKMRETKESEKMATIPTKLCNSNNPNTKLKADIRADTMPVTEIINSNPNTELKADISSSMPVTKIKNTELKADISSSMPVTKIKNTSPKQNFGRIYGTKTANTNFKGVPRKISYYIGQVALTTTEQNIIDDLTKTIPDGEFKCIKLKTDRKVQSFKLTANFSSKQALENSKNWPEGVIVRPWVSKNKMPTNTMQNNMAGRNGIEVASFS